MENCTKKHEFNFKNELWINGFTCLSVESKHEIAEYLCVSYRTIDRWISNDRPSKTAIKLLKQKKRTLNSYWDKFSIYKNEIKTPNGYEYSTRELETLDVKIRFIKTIIK